MILVTSNDAREVMDAISGGASDCLIRDELTAAGVERMICSVVEQGELLIGWSQDQWMGQPVSEFVIPDHRGVAQQSVKRTLDSRLQTRCQIEIVSRQGQRVLVEAAFAPGLSPRQSGRGPIGS